MRIAQLANFYSPQSGGLRIAIDQLGDGYRAAGHECLLIVPGRPSRSATRVHVPAVAVARTPYRLIVTRADLLAELNAFGPDRVEVSDKATLQWVGRWARREGVRSVLVSHERLDAVARASRLGWLAGPAERWTQQWAEAFDRIVCPSAFAAAEFAAGGHDVRIVPWGVQHDQFVPDGQHPPDPIRLVWVGRLSVEKQPELAVRTVAALARRRIRASLTFVGDGPRFERIRRMATGLPVAFTGRLDDRRRLASLVARNHVFLATGPAETFNLAAAEALACGLPVVCTRSGGTRELLTHECGAAVDGMPTAFADAVLALMEGYPRRRAAARCRSLAFGWDTAIERMLGVHELPVPAAR